MFDQKKIIKDSLKENTELQSLIPKSAKFIKSCPSINDCPEATHPEFAFIGRSNVGKSSLINLLCNNKNLAKVSRTPGKTKLINYFLIDDAWYLVDLPGYGYAKTAKTNRATWLQSTAEFLANRNTLKSTFVLIDATIPPQGNDLDFIEWLIQTNIPYALVFTKIDKINQSELSENIKNFLENLLQFAPAEPKYFTTSIEKKHSKTKLLEYISEKTVI
jgi:GTP-binding protein